MLEQRIVDALGRQQWLEAPSQALQAAVRRSYAAGGTWGQKLANALHGTWLGVPLHPVITDVPVGAWTVAAVFDTLDLVHGDDRYAEGADAAITIGLVAAGGAIASGLTDWHQTDTKPLRLGFVHAMLNLSATLLYLGALQLRKRGSRDLGRGLALSAYGIAGLGAHLGGDLVYKEKIGVNHAEPVWTPLQFQAVLADADLAEGELRQVEVGERHVMLARHGGQVYVLDAHCSHLGGPLADGELRDGCVQCPWHGSQFALEDGRVLQGPAVVPQPCYRVRIRGDQIEVEAGSS